MLFAGTNSAFDDEENQARWKRFNRNGFKLKATYNSVPTLGTRSTSPATTCVAGGSGPSASRPYVAVAPTLKAVVNDADPETDLRGVFEWQKWTGSAWGATASQVHSNRASGSTAQVTPALSDGVYQWRAKVEDPYSGGVDSSAYSGWCQFEVDTTDPASPTVTSADFPAACVCGSPGVTGSLTLSGGADVVEYRWGTTDPPTTILTLGTAGQDEIIAFTPNSGGPRRIYVQAKDRAGNLSTVGHHDFTVNPPAPNIARWLQPDQTGVVGPADTSGSVPAHDLSINAGNTAATARIVGEAALGLSGTSGNEYATASAVLDLTRSFTVAAWVRLTEAPTSTSFPTVISQAGSAYAGMELQAQPAGWCLNARDLDGNPANSSAVCGGAVALDVWTHVAGVYDEAAGRIRVYVNGEEVASTAHATPSEALATIYIGQTRLAGSGADYFSGSISDVRVWQRTLYSPEFAAMADAPAVGLWHFGEPYPPELDESGRFNHLFFDEPAVTAGVAGWDGTALAFDGTAPASTFAPVIHTDQSFTVSVWVNPTDLTGDRVVVSQDGVWRTGFSLGYSQGDGRWTFATSSVDDAVASVFSAQSTTAVVANEWTHLVGVYDAPAGQLRIYVNGVQGSVVASNVTNWDAQGPFRVGEAMQTSRFVGKADELRVHAGIVPIWKGDWRFEPTTCVGSPVVCADAATPAHPLQLAGGAAPTSAGRFGSGLTFATNGGATASGPVLDTTTSFTVAAWVRPTDMTGNRVAVSQPGVDKSAFQLGVNFGRYCMTVYASDYTAAPQTKACIDGAVAGEWVQLVGVYDSVAGTITVHVRGGTTVSDQSASTTFHDLWGATGALAVGRGGLDQTVSPWLGDIDEVRVHQGLISDLSILSS